MSLIATRIAKTAISAVAVAMLAIGMQAPVASPAEAGDWRGRGHYDGPRGGYRYAAPPRAHYYEPRRRNRGDQIAKGVAIGIGVAVVGAILADQARRTRTQYYDSPEY